MPAGLPQPQKNILGQFADEALDAGKKIVDPKTILESLLGKGKSQGNGENPGIEDLSGGQQANDPARQAMKQQQLIAKKQADDQQKAQALIQLHRQRLQEELGFVREKEQEEEMKKRQAEQEKQAEKQQQIVQLQHEKAKENVMGNMIKQFEGSKEQKAWGAG